MNFSSQKTGSILILMIFALLGTAKAQKINLETAKDDIGDGHYKDALKWIRKAQEHKETKNMADTWFWTAKILTEIATHKDSSVRILADDAVQGALDAMDRCKELDQKDEFKERIPSLRADLSGVFYQEGSKAFQDEDYEKAYKFFRMSGVSRFRALMKRAVAPLIQTDEEVSDEREAIQKLKKEGKLDSITFKALYYAGVSADQLRKKYKDSAELDTAALELYSQASIGGFLEGDALEGAARIMMEMGRGREMMRLIDTALAEHPEHQGLLRLRASYHIENGDLQKAEKSLSKALEKDPENMGLRLVLGSIYKDFYQDLAADSLGMDTLSAKDSTKLSKEYFEKADKHLSKVLKEDSSNVSALLNLAQLRFHKGKHALETAKGVKDKEKKKRLKQDGKEHLKSAGPLFEKVLEISYHMQTTKDLLFIYEKTGQKKKWERIRDKYFQRGG